jgi:hypothetical protein
MDRSRRVTKNRSLIKNGFEKISSKSHKKNKEIPKIYKKNQTIMEKIRSLEYKLLLTEIELQKLYDNEYEKYLWDNNLDLLETVQKQNEHIKSIMKEDI